MIYLILIFFSSATEQISSREISSSPQQKIVELVIKETVKEASKWSLEEGLESLKAWWYGKNQEEAGPRSNSDQVPKKDETAIALSGETCSTSINFFKPECSSESLCYIDQECGPTVSLTAICPAKHCLSGSLEDKLLACTSSQEVKFKSTQKSQIKEVQRR